MSASTTRFSPSRLRALREQAGLSRTALAYHCGVAEQTVWWWEKGRNSPRTTVLLAHVAAVLDCSLDDLFETVVTDDDQAGTPGRRENRAMAEGARDDRA